MLVMYTRSHREAFLPRKNYTFFVGPPSKAKHYVKLTVSALCHNTIGNLIKFRNKQAPTVKMCKLKRFQIGEEDLDGIFRNLLRRTRSLHDTAADVIRTPSTLNIYGMQQSVVK